MYVGNVEYPKMFAVYCDARDGYTFQCLATNVANKNRWFIQWLLEIFTFMGLFFGYNKYNVSFHEISFKLSISKSHFPDVISGVW